MHHPFCHLPAMLPPPRWAICHATTLPRCRAHLAILFSSPCTLPLRLPHNFQIRKMADNAFKASTPSRRQRERGYRSSSCARSRSPLRPTSSRKRRRSRSPKHEQVSPSECFEKRSHDGTQHIWWDKLEFFPSGTGPRGGACTVCLGCHKHTFSKCDGVKLWDGSTGSARKNEQGRLVAASGCPLCFDWQMPRGCSSTNHPNRHRCSGCGKAGHGAQTCSRAERA